MSRTPGFIVPSSFPNKEVMMEKLQEVYKNAGSNPPSVEELLHSSDVAHYGVKGMHWGVRKNTPTNSNYSRGQKDYDRKNFGQGGVKRINRRMNKGADIAKARKQEYKFRRRRSAAVSVGLIGVKHRKQVAAGAKVAGTILSMFAGVAAQHIAVKAEAKRGQAAAANTMGLPRQASSGPTYSKKSRQGVHNITSL